MRIPRIYSRTSLQAGDHHRLHGHAADHLRKVLRMKPGDQVLLFDGSGKDFPARLEQVNRDEVSAWLGAPVDTDRESPLAINLLQGISRGERMDYTLQKSTELGVHAIRPVWTERSQVRLQGERLGRRMAHWRGVIISSCEQCGRSVLPRLDEPLVLADCLQLPTPGSRLLLDHRAHGQIGGMAAPEPVIDLLVGPEGGLSEGELAAAVDAGFSGIGLGPRVLRTETAALAAISAMQALWGDFR